MLFIGFNLNSHNGIINTIFKLYFLHAEAKLKLKLHCEWGIFSVRRSLYNRRFQYLSINGGQTSVLTFCENKAYFLFLLETCCCAEFSFFSKYIVFRFHFICVKFRIHIGRCLQLTDHRLLCTSQSGRLTL